MALLSFDVTKRETLPPDEGKAAAIFSRLGYRIADAIADLVDNSVDAGASSVHIRFLRLSGGIHSVTIADDGAGMNDNELREAMRFGSRSKKGDSQLGKYGIGLKSASLSQADRVMVLSRKGPSMIGRRWTLPNIRENWSCDILRSDDVSKAFTKRFGDFKIGKHGTIVIWEELEHLKALPDNIDGVMTRTIKELTTELGIRFHRYLERGALAIGIDQQYDLEEPSDLPMYVSALNPFDYGTSPNKDYPAVLALTIGGIALKARCHIWPPRSNAIGYRLGGGKVALRQGFYFYRNDRLIQAGGWNQLIADDSEPHLSLARVEIDLPSALDSRFKLDVTKSRLDPGPEFGIAMLAATTKTSITFKKYQLDAQTAYRKQKIKDRARFPMIPGAGMPVKVQNAVADILREEGTGRPHKVAFVWETLDNDEVVRISAGSRQILLNKRFRKELAEGKRSDAPVLKMLLLFLLQEHLEKTVNTKVTNEWLQRVNLALLASLKA
jgi:hypothetical protein